MQTSKWASKCTVERARMGAQPALNYQWKSANVRMKLWLFSLMLSEDSKCMDWYNLLQFRYDDRTSEKRKHSTEECCSDLMNGLVLRCTTASCDARGQNSLDWRRSFSQVYLLRFWTSSAIGLAFISTSSSISSPDECNMASTANDWKRKTKAVVNRCSVNHKATFCTYV